MPIKARGAAIAAGPYASCGLLAGVTWAAKAFDVSPDLAFADEGAAAILHDGQPAGFNFLIRFGGFHSGHADGLGKRNKTIDLLHSIGLQRRRTITNGLERTSAIELVLRTFFRVHQVKFFGVSVCGLSHRKCVLHLGRVAQSRHP